jgi:hypothetical protein
MKKIVLSSGLGVLLACATAFAAEYTGYISDSHCGAKHMDGSQASIDCVTSCVKTGASPVFVGTDKKVYKVSDPAKVMGFLGKKVEVSGTMEGDTVTIEKVAAAK